MPQASLSRLVFAPQLFNSWLVRQSRRVASTESDRGDCNSSGSPWQLLPTTVQLHILDLLPPNSRALSGRLVSKDARDALINGVEHCTVSLSQPLPAHAVPGALAAWQQHAQQLPFAHKLQLLSTAAASGCEGNLEVALAVLQPSIFPEVLRVGRPYGGPDPGVSAVKAGHPQLLGWLQRHCPGLLHPGRVLAAAARHCNLAGLQATWKALQGQHDSRLGRSSSNTGSSIRIHHVIAPGELFCAAAGSATVDAVAKMQWVLATAGSSCSLNSDIAEAAARSGDLGRLRWLREKGFGLSSVLETALEHAHLSVAQWLVDEAGCPLPAAGGDDDVRWKHLFQVAAKSPDCLAKWQWLLERGAPPLQLAGRAWVGEVVLAAVRAGQVWAVRHLLSVFGAGGVLGEDREATPLAAARPGSVEVAACLHTAGLEFSPAAYLSAAATGSAGLPMVQWLAREARVSAAQLSLKWLREIVGAWPAGGPADSRALLEAAQLLVDEAGFCNWGRDSYWAIISGMGAVPGAVPAVALLAAQRGFVHVQVRGQGRQ